jgi:hypothetical protein
MTNMGYFCIISLAIVALSCVAVKESDEIGNQNEIKTDFNVPVFSLQELRDGSRRDELEHILVTTGLLSVIGSDQDMSVFRKTRQDAFAGLCACMKNDQSDKFASVQGLDSSMLSDQTTRITLATATIGDTPLPLDRTNLEDAGCASDTVQSLDDLRDYVAWVSKSFVSSLDEVLMSSSKTTESVLRTSQGQNYASLSSIVKASQNLEHFHLYSKPDDSNEMFDLDFHTDAGLFLTFVPGMACDVEANTMKQSHDFYFQMDGTTVRAIFNENSVGIMLGVGAEHWIKTSKKLKATRHAIAISPGQSRAWYGMSKYTTSDSSLSKDVIKSS